MGPRAILKDAYTLELMPSHLFGETQHKTIQARLSEDILYYKTRSRFFRTGPGRFFLREFITDETIPEDFRVEITARRRKRELLPDPVLCVAKDSLFHLAEGIKRNHTNVFDSLRSTGKLSYFNVKETPADFLAIWSFVVFARGEDVLTFRVGRYRAVEECLTSKRTLGFTSLVTEGHQTLFSHDFFGFVESGISALAMDLEFPLTDHDLEEEVSSGLSVVPVTENEEITAALVVFEAKCPNWFEPTKRRLSMNDLRWMPFHVPPNHLDDFDPWSQAVVRHRFAHDR